MERKFKEALSHRRSYYALSNKSLVSDEEIENIVKFAVKNIPSAFNSQSTRIVLLLGEQHVKLWNIVKDTLRKIVPAEAFKTTENKIDKSFASGYGRTENRGGITEIIPNLSREVPVMVSTDVGHASVGCVDHVGRCRFRCLPTTL